MSYETLTLTKGKERALERRHPWIFSGAFKELPASLEDGQLAEVRDSKGGFRAMGFFHRSGIALKVLSFEENKTAEEAIVENLKKALGYRNSLGLLHDEKTNCLRLVFGEGDCLPGLIIDKYDRTAVVQVHHGGWAPFLKSIAALLVNEKVVDHVYSRPSSKIKLAENLSGTLAGEPGEGKALENGHLFKIDWEGGQKTGFFIDQRENRQRLADFAKGRSVLNTFSYTGGFSIYALQAGATEVVSVDSSQPAIDLANHNAELNGVTDRHRGITADVFEHLRDEGDRYDIIVLDPPAFSKSRRTVHNAIQAYKRLNHLALQKIKPGGFIFTFSCSQHVDPRLFEDTVRAAAIEAGRQVRVVEKLGQPADHPVNIFHPEGEYLKGLVLRVD